MINTAYEHAVCLIEEGTNAWDALDMVEVRYNLSGQETNRVKWLLEEDNKI